MPGILPRAMMVLVVAVAARRARGQAGSDSLRDTTPAATPAASAGAAMLAMPAEARNYKLVDSTSLASDAAGMQYQYAHDHDTIYVFVAPYQSSDKVGTHDETTNFVLGEVDGFYESIYLAARQSALDRVQLLHRGSEDLQTHGHYVIAAAIWARRTKRGTSGRVDVFTYYAVYALPHEVVRLRAEMPWTTAANFEVVAFTKALIAGLAAQY